MLQAHSRIDLGFWFAAFIATIWWAYRSWQGLAFVEFGDETMRLAIVQQMRGGARLYLDAIDHQGPGTFMMAWFSSLLGAETLSQHRLLVWLISAASLIVMYCSPAWTRARERLTALGVFAALTGSLQIGWAGQMLMYQPVSGQLVVMAFSASLLPLLLRRIPGPYWLFATGAVWALAVFTAISFVIAAAIFGVMLVLLLLGRAGLNKALPLIAWYFAGGFSAAIAFAIWITAYSDWGGLYAYHVYFNTEFYSQYVGVGAGAPFHLWNLRLGEASHQSAQTLLMLTLGYSGLAYLAFTGSHTQGLLRHLIGGLLIAIALFLTLHFLDLRGASDWHAAATFYLCAGMFATAIARMAGSEGHIRWIAGIAVLGAALGTHWVYSNVRTFYGFNITVAAIVDSGNIDELYGQPRFVAIRQVLPEDARILAYPYFPGVYVFSERQSASAHLNFLPWQADYIADPLWNINRDPCVEVQSKAPAVIFLSRATVWSAFEPEDYAGCIIDYAENEMVAIEREGEITVYALPEYATELSELMLSNSVDNPVALFPAAPIQSGDVIEQRVHLPDGLVTESIGIQFATYAQQSQGQLTASIWQDGARLFETAIDASQLVDNAYHRLTTPRISGDIIVRIEGVDVSRELAPTIWLREPGLRPLMSKNGIEADGEVCLVFGRGRRLWTTPGCTPA